MCVVDHARDQTRSPCLLINEAASMNHGCKSLFTLVSALGEGCRSDADGLDGNWESFSCTLRYCPSQEILNFDSVFSSFQVTR